MVKDKLKVVVGMSGGVDSAVAAALLKAEGYEVSGVTMKIWDGKSAPAPGSRHGCYGAGEAEDIADAQAIARAIGIPHYVLDLTREYQAEVLDYFRREYCSGRTPNPCFRCNHTVKFGALLSKARDSGITFDCFATGHYAQVEYDAISQRHLLKKAKDLKKDQSYFIASLSQEQLGGSLFPLGGYTKEDVRKIATDFGLSVADKRESQDFVAGGYSALVGAGEPGPILDKQGHILGSHRGIPLYTIGQRQGLGLAVAAPLYVTAIDPEKNAITVGAKEELYYDELIATSLNWIAIRKLTQIITVKAKIRSSHLEKEATVTPLGEDKVKVKFSQPQLSITPGQTVVFYQGDIVVGAGTIE